jgi:hypothetical protein
MDAQEDGLQQCVFADWRLVGVEVAVTLGEILS